MDTKNEGQVTVDARKSLSDFQTKKATYFFQTNLDIERKGYLEKEDVEFYLLFHLTTVGKEGDEQLAKDLSLCTEKVWDYIVGPYSATDSNKLTLEQFQDMWATLSNMLKSGDNLPHCIDEWLRAGYNLYKAPPESKREGIPLDSFLSLYQRMGLSLNRGIQSFKALLQKYGQTLSFDVVMEIVKTILTTDDPSNPSGYFLPGFEVALPKLGVYSEKTHDTDLKQNTTASSPLDEVSYDHPTLRTEATEIKINESPTKNKASLINAGTETVSDRLNLRPPPPSPPLHLRHDIRQPQQMGDLRYPTNIGKGNRIDPIPKVNTDTRKTHGCQIPGVNNDDGKYIMNILKEMNIDPNDCEFIVDTQRSDQLPGSAFDANSPISRTNHCIANKGGNRGGLYPNVGPSTGFSPMAGYGSMHNVHTPNVRPSRNFGMSGNTDSSRLRIHSDGRAPPRFNFQHGNIRQAQPPLQPFNVPLQRTRMPHNSLPKFCTAQQQQHPRMQARNIRPPESKNYNHMQQSTTANPLIDNVVRQITPMVMNIVREEMKRSQLSDPKTNVPHSSNQFPSNFQSPHYIAHPTQGREPHGADWQSTPMTEYHISKEEPLRFMGDANLQNTPTDQVMLEKLMKKKQRKLEEMQAAKDGTHDDNEKLTDDSNPKSTEVDDDAHFMFYPQPGFSSSNLDEESLSAPIFMTMVPPFFAGHDDLLINQSSMPHRGEPRGGFVIMVEENELTTGKQNGSEGRVSEQ
ncbi:hypothetical protein ACOME3_009072 [Neoechinorhynchus agilis]